MKLFKLTIKSVNKWEKSHTMYVIKRNKNEAKEYVNSNLKEKFFVNKIYELGFELSGVMFKGGKKKK